MTDKNSQTYKKSRQCSAKSKEATDSIRNPSGILKMKFSYMNFKVNMIIIAELIKCEIDHFNR